MNPKTKKLVSTVVALLSSLLAIQWFLSGLYLVLNYGPEELILGSAIMCVIFWWIALLNIRIVKAIPATINETRKEAGIAPVPVPEPEPQVCPPHRWIYDSKGKMKCKLCRMRPG